MTHDEMIEAVARAIADIEGYSLSDWLDSARAAIRVIAPAVLEEAAREADDRGCEFTGLREGVMFDQLARAIRAMKTRYEQ